MSNPPHNPPPPADAQRAAANRRIAVFVVVFACMLAGAIWLVLREEKRRGILIQPTPKTAPEPVRPTPLPRPRPAPETMPTDAPPSSPALEQAARMEEALEAFRTAATHLVNRQFDQAEERALAALEAFPDLAAAQRILGLIYIQQGRIDRAISILETSLRLEPFNPEALTNLAFAYLQAQNPGLALELIETCRRLHPEYRPAIIQHGLMLMTQPDSEEAVETLREAVEVFPTLPGVRNNLAVALARRGQIDEARSVLRDLLELDPDNFSALFNLGGLYALETNAPAAVPWLRRAMQQISSSEFRRYLNDPDLAPIRDSEEFRQFLLEIDPVLPGPAPR